jgi:hypothetical protein
MLGGRHRDECDRHRLGEVAVRAHPTKKQGVPSVEELDSGPRSAEADDARQRDLDQGEEAREAARPRGLQGE